MKIMFVAAVKPLTIGVNVPVLTSSFITLPVKGNHGSMLRSGAWSGRTVAVDLVDAGGVVRKAVGGATVRLRVVQLRADKCDVCRPDGIAFRAKVRRQVVRDRRARAGSWIDLRDAAGGAAH